MRTIEMNDERSCAKCASPRTRIAGQSVSPAVLYVTCEACGHSSVVPCSSPSGSGSAEAMDARRVERLVRGIIEDFDLPMELLAIADAAEGWQLTLRTRLRRLVRIHLLSTEPRAIRRAITRALSNA